MTSRQGFISPSQSSLYCGVIVRNYMAVGDPAQRRRLRWVFWVHRGGDPIPVLFVADFIASRIGVEFEYFGLASRAKHRATLPGLPPHHLHLRRRCHRVVGIDVVVRRGLRYLMARNVLRARCFSHCS